MNVTSEIKSYIELKETCGALLLTGKWGCGKSYIMHQLADSLNGEDQYAVAIVSLFGVQSIEELDKKVKEAILYVRTINKSENDSSSKVSALIKNAKKLSSELSDVWQGFRGINAALSINLYDFFDIKSELLCFSKNGKTMVSKTLVLVFDDFERSKQDKTILLGTINNYCENKKIKTILIADENHIDEEAYKEFKEKVISHAIKIAANPRPTPAYTMLFTKRVAGLVMLEKKIAFRLTSCSRPFTSSKASRLSDLDTIKEIFGESKSDNLRTLKIWLTDFERVYKLWIELDLPLKDIDQVFYNFGAVMFEYKLAKCELDRYGLVEFKSNEHAYKGVDIQPERTSDKYKRLSRYRSFAILEKWIVSGEWDEETVKINLCAPYRKIPIKDEYYFVQSDFWSMTQDKINKFLPLILELAYKGDLSGDELINLIQRIKDLKKMGVTISSHIDYDRIYDGLSMRGEKIESGEIVEPERWKFIENPEELSPEAKRVYDELEMLQYKVSDSRSRKEYIAYLESPRIQFENHYVHRLAVFDDELYSLFVEKFKGNDNYKRLYLVDSLKVYLTELLRKPGTADISKTMCNLKKLSAWIRDRNLNERDGVRKYTYKVSEKKLTELIEVMMTTYEINITEKGV